MNQDFRDLLQAFADAGARFLVVGAYALAIHGRPRATGDLDIWVDATPENAARVHAALVAFGAPLADLTVEDLASPDVVYQIGVEPRRIDVLTAATGVTFAEAWPRRIEGVFDGVRFAVIGREDFIRNKRATGRPRDLVDVASLEADDE